MLNSNANAKPPTPRNPLDDFLTKDAQKWFIQDIEKNKISFEELYNIDDEDVDTFYGHSQMYLKLAEEMSKKRYLKERQEELRRKKKEREDRYKKYGRRKGKKGGKAKPVVEEEEDLNQLKVTGYLKFMKIKFEEITDQLEPQNFGRMRTSLIQFKFLLSVYRFVITFKKNNLKIMFSIFNKLKDLINITMQKPINLMSKDDLKVLDQFINLAKIFCFRFSYNRTVTEFPRDREYNLQVKNTHSQFLENLLIKFVTSNEEALNLLGEEDYKKIIGSRPKLKTFNSILNVFSNACNDEFKDSLSYNTCYEQLSRYSLQIFLRVLSNHEEIFRRTNEAKMINDMLFYLVTIFSGSVYILDDMANVYEDNKAEIIRLLTLRLEDLGLKTAEAAILLVLINSSYQVKEALMKLGRYSLMMRFKKEGIRIGTMEMQEEDDLSNFLLKVRDLKDIVNPYIKRLLQNLEPDFMQIGE